MSPTAAATANAWGPLRPLAWVEATRLIRHPAFLAGVAFVLIGSAMFLEQLFTSPAPSVNEDGWTVSVSVGVLAILTMVAANLAALRDRRDDTVEQHMTLPVAPSTRTGALIAATAGPATVAALLLAAVVGFAATRVPVPVVDQVHLAERLVTVVMLGALGVALARWLPTPFVAPVLAWGLFLVTSGDPPQAWQVLLPFAGLRDVGLALWHLGYLASLTVLFAVAALARSSRSRWLAAGGVVGASAVIGCAAVLFSRACPSGTGVCWF